LYNAQIKQARVRGAVTLSFCVILIGYGDTESYQLFVAGVKVSRNTLECHSGAQKFKPGAFRLQNY